MYEFILWYVIAMQVCDGVTTYIALAEMNGREANPVVRWVLEKLGLIPGLIAVKGGFALAVYFVQPHIYVLAPIALLYFFVVSWNTRLIYISYKKGYHNG